MPVAARTDPSALLSMPAIFGELGRDEHITAALPRLLEAIDGDGVQAAIRMVSTS